jgi:hypothetical protein
MLTERELFQKAFALVSNPETFAQGSKQCSEGRYCTGTAIAKYNDGKALTTRLWSLIAQAANLPDDDVFTVFRWNDTHTHEEVTALWRRVGEENGWLDGIADATGSTRSVTSP